MISYETAFLILIGVAVSPLVAYLLGRWYCALTRGRSDYPLGFHSVVTLWMPLNSFILSIANAKYKYKSFDEADDNCRASMFGASYFANLFLTLVVAFTLVKVSEVEFWYVIGGFICSPILFFYLPRYLLDLRLNLKHDNKTGNLERIDELEKVVKVLAEGGVVDLTNVPSNAKTLTEVTQEAYDYILTRNGLVGADVYREDGYKEIPVLKDYKYGSEVYEFLDDYLSAIIRHYSVKLTNNRVDEVISRLSSLSPAMPATGPMLDLVLSLNEMLSIDSNFRPPKLRKATDIFDKAGEVIYNSNIPKEHKERLVDYFNAISAFNVPQSSSLSVLFNNVNIESPSGEIVTVAQTVLTPIREVTNYDLGR